MGGRVTVARPPSGAAPVAQRRRPLSQRRAAALWRTAIVILFLLAWEVAARTGLLDARSVSRPSDIGRALGTMATPDAAEVHQALLDTLYALAVSFALSVLIGGLIGLLLALTPLLREAFLPILLFFLGMPKTVFLPLFLLFFGLGTGPAIAFGAVLGLLQVAVNVIAGVDSVEPRFLRAARAFGAGRLAQFVHVILPGAAPGLFAGLWHGIRNAFVGVLIAQMFVSNIGIGYLVKTYTNTFRVDQAMALVLLSAVSIIAIGSLWELAEARLTRWRTSSLRPTR